MKRQVRGAYKKSDQIKKPKQQWSLRIGDLVEFKKTGIHGVVIKDNGDGYYLVLSNEGTVWSKAAKLRCIEKAAHANKGQTEV